jgi:hypothetical protein
VRDRPGCECRGRSRDCSRQIATPLKRSIASKQQKECGVVYLTHAGDARAQAGFA